MKKLPLLAFLSILLLFSVSCNAENKKTAEKKVEQLQNSNKIEVIYFYSSSRCASCFKIENYTKTAVDSVFSNDVKSGNITFKMMNIEEEANKHFIEDYKLYTKSVVIRRMNDTKEVEYKNLDKIWSLLQDKDTFISYIETNINEFKNKKQAL